MTAPFSSSPCVRVCLLALALCWAAVAPAQSALSADELARIPVERMPAQNNAALLAAELDARRPGRAPVFAAVLPVKIRPTTHGSWTTEGNVSVWRTRISSPGAHSLNLGFSEYNLPAGAELALYAGAERLGPFTAADNEVHNELWTPMLKGDELVIELRVPTAAKSLVQLNLAFVNHDFLNFDKVISGACNVDVVCGAANNLSIVDQYRDIIRSVAALSRNGSRFCTGFLVNNVNQDGAPYFMTANHCGVNAGNAASLVTHWNFENSVCRTPGTPASGAAGNGSLQTFNSGATHLASYPPSDMTIVLLDDPINPDANAFFAGWSAEYEVPTDTMIAIHHPAVDEKRISFSFLDPYLADYFGPPNPDADHLEIPDWTIGTTEPGSSGSPVFDRFRRVRGQLHGGLAACGNDDFDSYGYFHTSWEGGGTPGTRLKDWLDPCGTGTLVVDGLEQSRIPFLLTAEDNCGGGCTTTDNELVFTLGDGFANGTNLTIVTSSDGISPSLSTTTAAGGDDVTLTIPATAGLATGVYTVTVRADDGTNSDDITLSADLISDIAPAPVAESPVDGAVEVLPSQPLEWLPVDNANGYDVQVSTSADFSSFVLQGSGLTSTRFAVDDALLGNETYFWRVRSLNDCGPGPWRMFSFTTADISCAAAESTETPVSISASGNPEVLVGLDVQTSFTVFSVEVTLDIEHSFVGDLSGILVSPDGAEIQLFERIRGGSCAGSNLRVTFSDAAELTHEEFVTTCTSNAISTAGTFQPAESLGSFAGENSAGEWTLVLQDNANLDGGAVTEFSLLLCTNGVVEDLSVAAQSEALETCINDPSSLVLQLGSDFSGDLSLRAEVDGQMLDNFTFDYNATDRTMTVDFTAWTLIGEGDYSLNLTVINGDGAERSVALPLSIRNEVAAVALTSPENDAQVMEGDVTFDWDASGGATDYLLQYTTTEDFSVIDFEQAVVTTIRTISDLPAGNVIYWRVIARNECGETVSEVRQFRVNPTGVHDFGAGRTLSVFPNPVRGELTVAATGNWPAGQLDGTLFDATGRRLARYRAATGARSQWDLGQLPAGVYYLRLAALGFERTERLVVLP